MRKQTPVIAITGGNGFVGSYLSQYFAAKGWRVYSFVHNLPDVKLKGVKYFNYELTARFEPSWLNGVDYLIHTAYLKHVSARPNTRQLNVRAAKQLLGSSRQMGVSKNIFVS